MGQPLSQLGELGAEFDPDSPSTGAIDGDRFAVDRLVAVQEDGTPLHPDRYTDEFHRLRDRAGLRRITLHELRHTSVSLMLDRGIPVHIVAAWHGHSPEVALRIYTHVQPTELQAAGAALFG